MCLGRPAGGEDRDDEGGHHAVQPRGERAAPAEVDVTAAERDRLDGAHRQRRERPDRDQRVHAGRAVSQEAHRGQERPATDDLDSDTEQEHGPACGRVLRSKERDRERAQRERPGRDGPADPVLVVRAEALGRRTGGVLGVVAG